MKNNKKVIISVISIIFIMLLGASYKVKAVDNDINSKIKAGDNEIKLEENIKESVIIPKGRTVLLDLNGYNIETKDSAIINEGTLTIKGNGEVSSLDKYALENNGGTLVINGGTYKAGSVVILNGGKNGEYKSSDIVINGGSFLGAKSNVNVIQTNGKSFTITGAEKIVGNVLVDNSNISGNKITKICGAKIDGNIIITQKSSKDSIQLKNVTAKSAEIYANKETKVEVINCNFENVISVDANVIIDGGKYKDINSNNNSTITIKGGLFTGSLYDEKNSSEKAAEKMDFGIRYMTLVRRMVGHLHTKWPGWDIMCS